MKFCFFLVVALFCLSSCQKSKYLEEKHGNFFCAALDKKSDSLYFVQIITSDSIIDRWELPYPVYRFQVGDITADGTEEILVGVVKQTRFDPSYGKRLFIFKNYHGKIRPLWLGSRLGSPLVDFCYVAGDEGGVVRSIEIEASGGYMVVDYKWRKFGLKFVKYVARDIEIGKARKLLTCIKD